MAAMLVRLQVSLDALAARVPNGSMLAVPPDYSFVAMAATRSLIACGVKDLHLLAVPQSGIQADLLIGAGCVATVECAAVTLGELGPAPRFATAVRSGRVQIKDSTCPAIHAALQAAEKGLPFLPSRGIIGSDLLRVRPDWQVIANPFPPHDPLVALPALKPDIALFHAPFADRHGNVWIGRRRELITMAHAAKESFVTVEEVRDIDLMADERWAAGALSSLYIGAIAKAKRGAWPLALPGYYEADEAALRRYAELASTEDGFANYLVETVAARHAAE
jgi:glutaconate CoA-transferase subunit A